MVTGRVFPRAMHVTDTYLMAVGPGSSCNGPIRRRRSYKIKFKCAPNARLRLLHGAIFMDLGTRAN